MPYWKEWLAGRIVIEVFEPELPVTARTFLNRCNPGAANTFKGTKVDRVVENYALFGGFSSRWVNTGMSMSTALSVCVSVDHARLKTGCVAQAQASPAAPE